MEMAAETFEWVSAASKRHERGMAIDMQLAIGY